MISTRRLGLKSTRWRVSARSDDEGATLELICNVGPAGLATGEEEGWVLEGTPYGTFMPLSPIIGITHLSVAGERIFAHD